MASLLLTLEYIFPNFSGIFPRWSIKLATHFTGWGNASSSNNKVDFMTAYNQEAANYKAKKATEQQNKVDTANAYAQGQGFTNAHQAEDYGLDTGLNR